MAIAAEWSVITAEDRGAGVVLLDRDAGVLHSRFRDDIEDQVVALWAAEFDQRAREFGGNAYLELLEDRLSNAVRIADRERALVRDVPLALSRLFERRVLGLARPAPVLELPLYSLRAAAGRFGEDMEVEPEGSAPAPPGVREGAFAVHVVGHSMEPEVPDGAIAVFRPLMGTRQGRRVLVWHRAASESGGEFTLKVYSSSKRVTEEGWEHTNITLLPLNPEFAPVVVDEQEASYRVLGEYLGVVALEDTF